MIIFFLLNEDFNLSVRCEFKAYENLDEMQIKGRGYILQCINY